MRTLVAEEKEDENPDVLPIELAEELLMARFTLRRQTGGLQSVPRACAEYKKKG